MWKIRCPCFFWSEELEDWRFDWGEENMKENISWLNNKDVSVTYIYFEY